MSVEENKGGLLVPRTDERGRYTWQFKTEVAKKYMLNGNARLVSELMEVPYDTLLEWRKEAWWTDLINELRKAQKAASSKKMTGIIEDSLELIQDRISNGDYVLNNKTGAIERKPVSLRDAANMTNQLLARQLQMEELADKMEHRHETVQETLQLLAKEFSKWKRIENKEKAEDVEYAIYDERQAGLQEGSGEVYEQAGGEEEASGAERSSTDNGESR